MSSYLPLPVLAHICCWMTKKQLGEEVSGTHLGPNLSLPLVSYVILGKALIL